MKNEKNLKNMAFMLNDYVACRLRAKMKDQEKPFEFTSHGVCVLEGSVGTPIYNKDILSVKSEDMKKLTFGDQDSGYNLIDLEELTYLREAGENEMGAITLISKNEDEDLNSSHNQKEIKKENLD